MSNQAISALAADPSTCSLAPRTASQETLRRLAHRFQSPRRNTAAPVECCTPAWRCSRKSDRRHQWR